MKTLLFTQVFLLLAISNLYGMDLRGFFSLEGQLFLQSPAYENQQRNVASIAAQGDFHKKFNDRLSLNIIPFIRIDSGDSERTYQDLRSAHLLYFSDDVQLVVGSAKVFWGVTEFVHLVDIINQTDTLESIDNEEKLGQPMIHISLEKEWGIVEGFLLPYFRERKFPGHRGRPRGPAVIEDNAALFESGAEEYHTDFAIRYSHTIGAIDFGIHHFMGTAREPLIVHRESSFVPLYQQINQTGIDLQLIHDQWLWKLETLHRTGQGSGKNAVAFGVEYTWVGPLDISMDLGAIVEYVWDDRQVAEYTPYDNDVMVGLRLAFHDEAGSEILLGIVKDIERNSSFCLMEASRRIAENFKVEVSGFFFGEAESTDSLVYYQDDSFFRLELKYYF